MPKRNQGPAQIHFREHLYDVTDECMIWPYATDTPGYGRLWVNGRCCAVTILACEAHNGPMPEPKMDAAHGPCHNRACWNGAHLSWKTRADNSADRGRDATEMHGEAAPWAKLTAVDVLAIRSTYAQGGVTQRALAAVYGVGPDQVSRIVAGKRWARLGVKPF